MGTWTVKGEPFFRENAKSTKTLDAIQLQIGTKKKERNLKKMSEDALRLLKMKFTRFLFKIKFRISISKYYSGMLPGSSWSWESMGRWR